MFAQITQKFSHTAKTWLQHWLFPDVPMVQATDMDLPIQPAPTYLYSAVSSYLSRIPIPDRQLLMLYLYDANMYVEELTDRIVRDVLGKTGFVPTFKTPDTYTEGVIMDFWELNGLGFLEAQERMVRDYLVIGEVIDLVGACSDSFLLGPLVAPVVEQTILDPKNCHRIIGVKQRLGLMEWIYHKAITDERTLTREAQRKRNAWEFPCFLFQNIKKTAPIPAPGLDDEERIQKRGEPFLYTASDLFKALVDYLWTSIDRVQALNTFNWGFKITSTGTKAQKRESLNFWKKEIGQPKPNSSFFYTDEIEPQPFAFPAGVATAIEGLFKLLRDTAGWKASSRNEDMGDSDVRYASMRLPGVTNPSLATLVNIQTKCRQEYQRRLNYVLTQKWEQGKIPKGEVDLVRGRPRFRYTLLSSEISKQDMGQASTALKTFEDAWNAIYMRQIFTEESLAAGEQKMAKELLDIELELRPEEERQAMQPPEETPQNAIQPDEDTTGNEKKMWLRKNST